MLPNLSVVDMHTAGEPIRIVREGYPAIEGHSILAKRRYVSENLDYLRKFLIFEPRGHFDMYGAVLVPPALPDADLAVLFMHNQGYSTMCGHAVIALGRYAVDAGLVPACEPVTEVRIECPCGLVTAHVEVKDGTAGAVSFVSVPAFVHSKDLVIAPASLEDQITVDVSYGGAFYGLAKASDFGLDVRRSTTRDLVEAANEVSAAIRQAVKLEHPEEADLAYLYGTILTDGNDAFSDQPTANICVFADSQVDRSPTGSGVTARLAAQYARDLIEPGQVRVFESCIGTTFKGAVADLTACGPFEAIRARVSGKAHYTGRTTFLYEEDDPVGFGFLPR
ncbi:proline racemase family protein [Pseudovibrio exalbescens]|uniref:4-hydroxyproline epimerase n=1 Tax=Pseudovibrio exalbescens TaxID=197461 RepID=A0A1U7JI23_9HYPH|nr:proline racemase family protein [Pseudovibrio exalbescens]OKL44301.1 proline racemase [Pseudovibrio exalbescens]